MKLDLWKNGIIISCSLAVVVQGFSSNNVETTTTASTFTSTSTTVSRRSLLQDLIAVPAVATAGLLLSSPVEPAQASGGATAGGAYLLSAKQRYNDRVTKAVKGLLEAGAALAEGNSKAAKAYFGNEEVGSWKDLTAAGYLLSNAFRRSSTTAPDSLPAVKKYKAFAAEVDVLQKILKKKGAEAASAEFAKVEEFLDVWLAEIELPPAREL